MMRKGTRLVWVLLMLKLNTVAQFNDSVHHYLNVNLGGTLSHSSTDKNYLLNNGVRYGYNSGRSQLNFNAGWIYGENNTGRSNNDFTTAVDFNIYKDTAARMNYWALAAYTTSYSLKINNQFQAGAGAAYKLLDRKSLYVRVSDGILFEQSDLFLEDSVRDRYSTFRNSLRLQLRASPIEWVSFDATAFWQPSLQNISDYIITSQAGLTIKLIKWLSLVTRFNYNRISRTGKANLLFTYGLLIEQYF